MPCVWSARLSRALSFPPFPGSHLEQRNVLMALEMDKEEIVIMEPSGDEGNQEL